MAVFDVPNVILESGIRSYAPIQMAESDDWEVVDTRPSWAYSAIDAGSALTVPVIFYTM